MAMGAVILATFASAVLTVGALAMTNISWLTALLLYSASGTLLTLVIIAAAFLACALRRTLGAQLAS
ncbi:MAG: hypothetical protein ACU0AT_06100 [Tranquillimonas sp.]